MKLLNFRRSFLGVALLAFAAPSLALAAYNDVTLTTALNVSGSTAAVQSIVVNASNFSVTLASGSSFTVVSPTFQQLSSDVTSDVTNNTCTGSASSISLAYSGAGTVTNLITPSATLCANAPSTSAPSTGGGGVISGPLSVGFNKIANSSSTPLTTVTGVTTTSTPNVAAQAQALTFHFARNLQYQDRDPVVQKLQEFLNTHGAPVSDSGGGSPGKRPPILLILPIKLSSAFRTRMPQKSWFRSASQWELAFSAQRNATTSTAFNNKLRPPTSPEAPTTASSTEASSTRYPKFVT